MVNRRTNASTGQTVKDELNFRKLFEYSYTGVTLLDKDLHVIYRSPSAERITGWNTMEIRKRVPESLIHPDDRHLFAQLIVEALARPGKAVTQRFRAQHHLGHYIWLKC